MERKPDNGQKPGRDGEAWRARLAKDMELDEEHRKTWGDTDEVLRARYVAGMCTADEKVRVEHAMRDFPAVRESIEIGRELAAEDASTPIAHDDAGQRRSGRRPRSDGAGRPENEPGTSR